MYRDRDEMMRRILKLEERMNLLMRKQKKLEKNMAKESANPFWFMEQEITDDMNIAELMQTLAVRHDLDIVNDYLHKRGYVCTTDDMKEEVDYPRFYNDIQMNQSVWSRYFKGTQSHSSPDTLYKILLGLRMSVVDSCRFLLYNGCGFAVATDLRDRIILSYIMLDYYEDEDIDDIIENIDFFISYYSGLEEKAGRKPLKKIFNIS